MIEFRHTEDRTIRIGLDELDDGWGFIPYSDYAIRLVDGQLEIKRDDEIELDD